MVNMVNVVKVIGKAAAVVGAAVVGAELGFAGGAAAMNDGIYISKKYQPKLVKVKGVGPFKRAVVSAKNPFTGEVTTTTIKIKKTAAKKNS